LAVESSHQHELMVGVEHFSNAGIKYRRGLRRREVRAA
jgi:hypothetical protein